MYPKQKNPKTVKSRKGKNYALWCLSNSLFTFFNPSKSVLQKSRLKSHGTSGTINQNKCPARQKNNSNFSQKPYKHSGNLITSPEITNALKTGKRNLMNLLHSFCNNHRTLLLKNSAKETSRVLPSELKPSKSNLALPYLPLIKPQTLSFKTKAMPIV
jgi:hypothetical protein